MKKAIQGPVSGSETVGGDAVPDRLYEMVVKALRAEILTGVHSVGLALPSESVLVARFGVSRHTVREALRQLRDLGLVTSRQGYGTVVVQPGGPQHYVHRVDSISDLHDYGVVSTYSGDTAQLIKATPELVERVGGEVGQAWLRIEGRRLAPGRDVPMCDVEIFVAARFAGVGRLLGTRSGPIFALIEAIYGESIGSVEQAVRAYKLATTNTVLALEPGETVVEIKRVYRTLDAEIAEITFNRYPADRFSMSMNLKRVRQ